MPTSSNPLHDLLVSLLELEDRAKEDLERQAHPIAVARLLKGKELLPGRKISKKQRVFIKAVQQGKRDINEVYRSDQPLWFAYRLQLTQAKHDVAAPLVRDSNKTVNGRLETRRSPLNLALHELVIAGIGADENQIRDYLVDLNPFWGRGPDPSIAKSLADMHEKGVTDTILQKLRRQHRQLFKGGVFLRPDERATEDASALQHLAPKRNRVLERCMEIVNRLIAQCGPPTDAARTGNVSEFWFDLNIVEQLMAGLNDLGLGAWAVALRQDAQEAEEARATAHASSVKRVGGWKAPNHEFLMGKEGARRTRLLETTQEIRNELESIAADGIGNSPRPGEQGAASPLALDTGDGTEKAGKTISPVRQGTRKRTRVSRSDQKDFNQAREDTIANAIRQFAERRKSFTSDDLSEVCTGRDGKKIPAETIRASDAWKNREKTIQEAGGSAGPREQTAYFSTDDRDFVDISAKQPIDEAIENESNPDS